MSCFVLLKFGFYLFNLLESFHILARFLNNGALLFFIQSLLTCNIEVNNVCSNILCVLKSNPKANKYDFTNLLNIRENRFKFSFKIQHSFYVYSTTKRFALLFHVTHQQFHLMCHFFLTTILSQFCCFVST